MFSGAPDPVFALEESEGSEAKRQLSEAIEAARAPNAAWLDEGSNTLFPNKLGYGGLSIREIGADGNPLSVTEINGRQALVRILGLDPRVVPVSEGLESELLALAAAKKVIDAHVLAAIETTIAKRAHLDSQPPGHSMKGWEVYSWRNPGGEWRYALLIGTNRWKAEQEIQSAAITEQALRQQLEQLPPHEWVSLQCVETPTAPQLPRFRTLALERPPSEVLDRLAELGRRRGLELSLCD